MLDKAIAKIKTEMEKSKNNPFIQVVGKFLLQHIRHNPLAAEKIMAEGKTIGKSLDEMRKAAEQKKVGNCAVLTDQEGFLIVSKYFGIEPGQATAAAVKYEPVTVPEKPAADFDVKLEDLL